MGVDRDGRLAEREQQHDVGAFAADARQAHQAATVARHHTVVLVDQRPAQPLQVAGLHVVEPGRPERPGDRRVGQGQDGLGRVGQGEQRGLGPRGVGVPALGRQQAGYQGAEIVRVLLDMRPARPFWRARLKAAKQLLDAVVAQHGRGAGGRAIWCRTGGRPHHPGRAGCSPSRSVPGRWRRSRRARPDEPGRPASALRVLLAGTGSGYRARPPA